MKTYKVLYKLHTLFNIRDNFLYHGVVDDDGIDVGYKDRFPMTLDMFDTMNIAFGNMDEVINNLTEKNLINQNIKSLSLENFRRLFVNIYNETDIAMVPGVTNPTSVCIVPVPLFMSDKKIKHRTYAGTKMVKGKKKYIYDAYFVAHNGWQSYDSIYEIDKYGESIGRDYTKYNANHPVLIEQDLPIRIPCTYEDYAESVNFVHYEEQQFDKSKYKDNILLKEVVANNKKMYYLLLCPLLEDYPEFNADVELMYIPDIMMLMEHREYPDYADIEDIINYEHIDQYNKSFILISEFDKPTIKNEILNSFYKIHDLENLFISEQLEIPSIHNSKYPYKDQLQNYIDVREYINGRSNKTLPEKMPYRYIGIPNIWTVEDTLRELDIVPRYTIRNVVDQKEEKLYSRDGNGYYKRDLTFNDDGEYQYEGGSPTINRYTSEESFSANFLDNYQRYLTELDHESRVYEISKEFIDNLIYNHVTTHNFQYLVAAVKDNFHTLLSLERTKKFNNLEKMYVNFTRMQFKHSGNVIYDLNLNDIQVTPFRLAKVENDAIVEPSYEGKTMYLKDILYDTSFKFEKGREYYTDEINDISTDLNRPVFKDIDDYKNNSKNRYRITVTANNQYHTEVLKDIKQLRTFINVFLNKQRSVFMLYGKSGIINNEDNTDKNTQLGEIFLHNHFAEKTKYIKVPYTNNIFGARCSVIANEGDPPVGELSGENLRDLLKRNKVIYNTTTKLHGLYSNLDMDNVISDNKKYTDEEIRQITSFYKDSASIFYNINVNTIKKTPYSEYIKNKKYKDLIEDVFNDHKGISVLHRSDYIANPNLYKYFLNARYVLERENQIHNYYSYNMTKSSLDKYTNNVRDYVPYGTLNKDNLTYELTIKTPVITLNSELNGKISFNKDYTVSNRYIMYKNIKINSYNDFLNSEEFARETNDFNKYIPDIKPGLSHRQYNRIKVFKFIEYFFSDEFSDKLARQLKGDVDVNTYNVNWYKPSYDRKLAYYKPNVLEYYVEPNTKDRYYRLDETFEELCQHRIGTKKRYIDSPYIFNNEDKYLSMYSYNYGSGLGSLYFGNNLKNFLILTNQKISAIRHRENIGKFDSIYCNHPFELANNLSSIDKDYYMFTEDIYRKFNVNNYHNTNRKDLKLTPEDRVKYISSKGSTDKAIHWITLSRNKDLYIDISGPQYLAKKYNGIKYSKSGQFHITTKEYNNIYSKIIDNFYNNLIVWEHKDHDD